MPKHKKHKLMHVARGKGPATDVYRLHKHEKPSRFRFDGIVMHKGKKMRQRLGFKGATKVVEVAFVPIKRRSR